MNTGLSRRALLKSVSLAVVGSGFGAVARGDVPSSLHKLDGVAQARLVKDGEVSAVELVRAAIDRIERLNPILNAVVSMNAELALTRAAEIDRGRRKRVFEGLPFLVKDLTETAGIPTQNGSRMFRGFMADNDHPIVDAWEDAGAVVLGKTATPEFGLIATTEPLVSGPCRNPWSLDHTPGGSSGGAGSAVASGMVPVASGSDGGGSIRVPSSQCGVFGLKTSMGVPIGSAEALPGGISVKGVLSRSVRDSAVMLPVYAHPGRGTLVTDPIDRSLKVGLVINDHFGRKPHPDVVAATESTAALVESLGHRVEPTAFSFDGAEMMNHFMSFWTQGPKRLRDTALERGLEPEAVLEPWTLGLAAMGDARGEAEVAAAITYLNALGADRGLLGEFDVLLSPVLGGPPIRIGEQSPILPFEGLYDEVLHYVGYTPVANVTGVPAMSVPLNWNEAGLPIGSQFLAWRGEDAMLLRLAFQLEQARPWAGRWAPNSAELL
jgi:amidase